MSFLTLKNGIPDFSKAVISLWFRVPQASIDAAHGDNPLGANPILYDSIPLFSFGRQPKNTGMGPESGNICSGGATIIDIIGFSKQGEPYPLDPCCIALNCEEDDAVLTFNIRMDKSNNATGTNIFTAGSSAESLDTQFMSNEDRAFYLQQTETRGSGWDTKIEQPDGPGTPRKNYFIQVSGITDFSTDALSIEPEHFYVKTTKAIEPDQWHHLLLSFDLSQNVATHAPPVDASQLPNATFWNNVAEGVTSHAKLWYAIDDVDYRGRAENYADSRKHNLGPWSVDSDLSGTSDAMGDPNGILTEQGFNTAFTGSNDEHNLIVEPDTYSYTPNPIPTADELGLPASARYVDHVYRVELAEFQMFTDKTLDTKIDSNRRAFIDYERDEDGNPIPDEDGSLTLKSVNPKKAEELLGKRQDVLLHGSSNWKTGYNTGSTGVEVDYDDNGNEVLTKIPGGQFEPTAMIREYKPNPSLKAPG